MPLVYSYKPSRDCYVVSGQNYIEPSVNGIPTVYDDGINGTKNVKEIADFGFFALSNLEAAIIPSGIDYIGKSAFEATQIKNLFILDSKINIGPRAFSSTLSLTGLFLGNSIINISSGAFFTSRIVNLYLPDTLTGIGESAFENNFFLRSIKFGTGLKVIQDSAFRSCYNITGNDGEYIFLPENLEYLGGWAFANTYFTPGVNNSSLKEFRLGSRKLKNIMPNTFYNQAGLRYFYMPDSGLTGIGGGVFEYCVNLKNIYIPDNIILSGDSHFKNCPSLQYARIPSGINVLPRSIFQSCSSLRRIDVPQNITYFDQYALAGCHSIGITGQTAIPAPFGIFGDSAVIQEFTGSFNQVGLLTGVGTGINDIMYIGSIFPKEFELPTGLQSLGFSSIETTRLPKKLYIPINFFGFLNYNTFHYLNGPEEFDVDPNNSFFSSHSGLFYNKDKTSLLTVPGMRTGEIKVHPNAINAPQYCFTNQIQTGELNLAETNLKSLGNRIFLNSKFNNIILPTGLNSLGYGAFQKCINITGISLPTFTGIRTLESLSFVGCTSLKYIKIPDNIQVLGPSQFEACPNLRRIDLGTGINYGKTAPSIYGVSPIEYNDWMGAIHAGNPNFPGSYMQLTGICVADNHPSLKDISGVLYTKDLTILVTYPGYRSLLDHSPSGLALLESSGEYRNEASFSFNIFPRVIYSPLDSVTGISRFAFGGGAGAFLTQPYSTTWFDQINLGPNIKRVSDQALVKSRFLKNVNITNGTFESVFIFPGTTHLTGINFSETGKIELQNSSIAFCRGITGLYIPSGVKLFNSSVFSNCINLQEIKVHPDNPDMSSQDGILYNKAQTEMIIFPLLRFGDITLPDNLTGIGSAFNNAKISSLKFGTGIKTLRSSSITNCALLTGLYFGETMTDMQEASIENCNSLTEIYFGKNIENFYSNTSAGVFKNCASIKKIVYPNKVFTLYHPWGGSLNISGRDILNIDPDGTAPWPGIGSIFFNCFTSWTDNKPKEVIRYTPINDQQAIINHIDFRLSNHPFNTFPLDPSIAYIPEYIQDRKIIGISGMNFLTGIFGKNDNYTKTINIPSGIELKNLYPASLMISGLNILEKIEVNINNPYLTSQNGILFTKNKDNLIAVPRKCQDTGLCIEANVISINSEAFAYNENINNITFKGNAPQIGQNIFTGANSNLKIYRKKYAKGFGEYLQDRKIYYKSDNIILTNGPTNKFNIFTGENGKMTTFYTC